MSKRFKIVVQKCEDGYLAYPLGLKGVVIGDGDTFEEALENVRSAITFHINTFGDEVLADIVDSNDIHIEEAEVAFNA